MTTKLSSITRRTFCRGLFAMAALPLAARCGAMAQTYTQGDPNGYPRSSWRSSLL